MPELLPEFFFLLFFPSHFFSQMINLSQVPYICDDHDDLPFLVADRAACYDRLFSCLKLLLQGHHSFFPDSHKRTGHGNYIPALQFLHVFPEHICSVKSGDRLICPIDFDCVCPAVRDINAIEGILNDSIQPLTGFLYI